MWYERNGWKLQKKQNTSDTSDNCNVEKTARFWLNIVDPNLLFNTVEYNIKQQNLSQDAQNLPVKIKEETLMNKLNSSISETDNTFKLFFLTVILDCFPSKFQTDSSSQPMADSNSI